MTDILTRYECDACGFAVPLADLIPTGHEHWCRCCIDRANASTDERHARDRLAELGVKLPEVKK